MEIMVKLAPGTCLVLFIIIYAIWKNLLVSSMLRASIAMEIKSIVMEAKSIVLVMFCWFHTNICIYII